MTERSFNDEGPLDRFETAWLAGGPPALADFLPPPHDPARRAQLEELIKIDLEYRWRRPAAADVADELPSRPRLEDYARHFPELGPSTHLPTALIGEEYRVRRRWGDRPVPEEYAHRFPWSGAGLDEALAAIDAELGAEPCRERPMPPLRCPHCHHSLALSADALPPNIACQACGGAFTLEASAGKVRPPVQRVGRYELGELLGTGAFGSVWRAWDTELSREVAVKLPRTGQLATLAEEERFLREARSAARLHHPGIVAVHDVGREGQTVYQVSDLVRGRSLAQWLEHGRLDFDEAADLVALIADALDYAHRQGVVHRDVKPSNIMLEVAGPLTPRLMDFGLAKRDAGEITLTLDGQVLGTPAYMAPEQVRDPHAVDGRGDVYSLGVILYQLLTGELPFRGTARMVLLQVTADEPRPPRRLNDRIPRDLETICLKAMAKEPRRRYRTAAALAVDLRRWRAGEGVRARRAGSIERLWGWVKRRPGLAVAAALAVVALVVVVGQPAAAFLVVVSVAATLYALYQGKVAAELRQATEHLSKDQLRTAGALQTALHQCQQLRQERDQVKASAGQSQRRFAAVLRDLAVCHGQIGNLLRESGQLAEALASYRESLRHSEALAEAEPGQAQVRRDLAAACYKLGQLAAQLAADPTLPRERRRECWHEARMQHQRSLDLVSALRQRGLLPAADASIPDMLAAEIARCDASLTRLSDSLPLVPASGVRNRG